MEPALPEGLLSAIADSSEDAVIILDPSRVIRFANKTALFFGQKSGAGSVVGENYDEILKRNLILDEAGNTASPDMYPSNITLRTKKAVRGRIFQQIINGTSSWVRVSTVPLIGADGEVTHVIVRLTDVSERKDREDKIKFLIESSKIFPIAGDMEEHLKRKARLTVPLIADWCTVNVVKDDGSLSRIAVIHRSPERIAQVTELAERSHDELSADTGIRHVAHTGVAEFYPEVGEALLARSGQSPERLSLARSLEVNSAMILPIISQGSVLAVLSLAYAESKRTYTAEDFEFMKEYCGHISTILENARLYEEIRKRDLSKDSFLATLSHELRNPLAPIKSMLELMKLQPDPKELKHNISVIEHQFDHLTKVLNDLLEVTRYSRGKIHVELRRVNLLTVMKNSEESAKPFFHKKGLTLSMSLPQHPIIIRADQTRLEQALMNVLHNAEKFTPTGGEVVVAVTSTEDLVAISIRDTGIGIEPDMLAHIFEPGLRDGGAHKTDGLGLGLVLVKEIVQLHGGKIRAKSEGAGKGSEFIITLPILQQRLL
jgi:PAS domain S-box-containing protein